MSCPWQGRLTAEQAERGDSTVKNQYLALDYGGTFTKYAMMDREGRFLCEGKVPSACDSLEHMLACVAPLQEQFQGQYDGVAVSMPGRIDTARGVACTGGSFHFIRNTPIQHCLEKIFQAPVTVANDGKCAASAEAWSGALAGVEDGAVILLGTGTGGGLVLGGHVRMGCTFGAGEFSFLGADLGRLSEGLVKGGPYREAVWVDYMSATGLLRLYGRQKGAAGALPDMDGIGFFEAYDRGEPEAAAALDQFGRYAAAGIYSIQAVVDVQRFAIGGGVSAIFGITKPAIYSITLQHKRVLFGVMTGSFISGSFIGLMAVKAFVAMGPGLAGMAMFVDPENTMNIVWAFAGFGIALAASFVATLILYQDEGTAGLEVSHQSASYIAPKDAGSGKKLFSPIKGKLVPLSEVPDEVFSAGTLGDGAAIVPEEGSLYAPADAVVENVFDSKHAICLNCKNGADVLLHVGIDTVKLGGRHYDVKVKNGDQVKAGQLLMTFDKKAIEAEGYSTVIPVIITNSDSITVHKAAPGAVSAGSTIMTFE